MGPLAGVRIIDLTAVLMGPYATQFLGDLGADVIKVEPPKGDLVRSIGPARHSGMGPIFLNANRSKRSIVINLKTPEGRELLLDLCRDADALVYNVRPAAMARLGLSYEEVSAVNPRIVYAGLYGYGQDGQYARRAAYDDLIQGGATLGHLFQLSGSPEPRYVPAAIADRIVGLTALSGILAALLERERTGRGQRVDVPMFETMVGFILGDHLGGLTYDPPLDKGGYARQLARDRRPFRTADGYVCALVYTDEHWQRFVKAINQPDLLEKDPRFATFSARMENVDHVYGWLTELFLTRTSAEWIALLDEHDIPVMAMHTFETVLEDPHLSQVGFFRRVKHPSEGDIITMANPIRLSGQPAQSDRLAPQLGEHTVEVLREIGKSEQQISELLQKGIVSAASARAEGGRG
ncbi:CoA transferase [Chelativorans composti]|jgi:Predicted acyl-CoA transferases/carnitine dehydratase|uniref:CaiB/BaiF CoA transferase family protein n=1 Tax=Chelativorans composti TaxID=768533 RepID=A0ABW5DCG1_9HYPH|nr:CoA transferase [bacterium SGD-2]